MEDRFGRVTTETTWKPCPACGATTRHDDDLCIRDPRHPRYDERTPPALRGPTAVVAKEHEGGNR